LIEIKTIGIVGAGTLGQGIAYRAAAGGYRTMLEDISRDRLADGLASVSEALDRAARCGYLTGEQRARALENLVAAHAIEDVCRQADLLIETVADELEAKLEIFTLFDRFAKPGTILASTTVSLSIADLAGSTFCDENCVGLRFAAPVAEARRLDVVRAPATSDEAVAACAEVGRRMGKEVVIVLEHADFGAGAGRQLPK